MRKKHFASLSIFQILAQFRRGIFYFFLSIYLWEFLGVSYTEMTLFATLPMIANIAAQSGIWGRISDKLKKRRLLIVFGEVFAAIGYLIVFWIHNSINKGKIGVGHINEVLFSQGDLTGILQYAITFDETFIPSILRISAYVIIFGFTIIEAGWSSSNLGWTTLIADLTRDSERSKTMGLLQFIGGIGNVIGVTASGFLYQDGFGFWLGDLFYISSGIMIFGIVALFMIPESYADLDENYFKEIDEKENNNEMRTNEKDNQKGKTDWPTKLFIWFLIILAIVNIGGNSINQMIQIYVRLPTTFEASAIEVAWLRNTSSIAMIIAGLAIGFLTTRFGDSKMLLAGFLCAFVGTIALPFAPHISIFFIYMALKGISRVWIQTTAYSMVNRVVPQEQRGRMMGYYNATFYLSWGLGGTAITGPITDSLAVNEADITPSNIRVIIAYVIIFLAILGSIFYLFIGKIVKLYKQKKSIIIIVTSLFVSSLAVLIFFVYKPMSYFFIYFGPATERDPYATIISFFVAAVFIVIGIFGYLAFRPNNFKLLNIDKNSIIK
ncbi:MAG: MFS transporter [Candidatus Heimdallarchaeota archaeon]|nr:MFS transporter [Candidatus Heimdallarchaeota archaeon]